MDCVSIMICRLGVKILVLRNYLPLLWRLVYGFAGSAVDTLRSPAVPDVSAVRECYNIGKYFRSRGDGGILDGNIDGGVVLPERDEPGEGKVDKGGGIVVDRKFEIEAL